MLIVKAAPGVPFSIGRQGEHKVRTVVFDLSDWVKALGDGRAEVLFQRPRDSAPYPVPVEQDGGLVTWLVTKTDTDQPACFPACAKCEVRWYLEDALAKSAICSVSCYQALDAPGEIPDPPGQSWLDQALEAGVQAQEAAQRAENAAVHQPIIQGGTWWVWNPLTGVYEDTGTSASGSGSSSNAVQYVEQALTKDQKTQARQNIGAASSEEVSKLSADKLDANKLPEAVNDALAQAKASGEFDGADGAPGKDGQDGYTPQKGVDYFDGAQGPAGPAGADGKTPEKGVDYWTADDKSAIVSDVLAALPTWEGGSY